MFVEGTDGLYENGNYEEARLYRKFRITSLTRTSGVVSAMPGRGDRR